jgi:hypothetical protein
MSEDAKIAMPVVLKMGYSLNGLRRFRKLRRVIKSLENGSTLDGACKNAGINITTLWRWRIANPRLTNLLFSIVDSRVQVAEDSLYNQVVKGNIKAVLEFLYNRAPLRWKNSAALNQTINIQQNADKKDDRFLEAPRFVFTSKRLAAPKENE